MKFIVTDTSKDERYFELIAKALRVCQNYKPMFGKGRKGGMSLNQFQETYRADPFYNWIGLDSPHVYAAHKAAGGMTSIYRQLGIGCQWVFSAMLQDNLGLTNEEANWKYQVPLPKGKTRTLALDGRIDLANLKNKNIKKRVEKWLNEAGEKLLLSNQVRQNLKGVVFEVRQGYKSKDSKRQNADIANASNAYANLYLPTLFLLSTQIDESLVLRYTRAQWLLLIGNSGGNSTESSYSFCRDVVGYDFAGFFERNSARLKQELENILTTLLKA